ncbi:hypothetical protein [Acidovorax sacchari]|uniref:hypothetical protein n=1 Tax=Acidovorax sacchari TaxID=3230736 RepID=UPI0039E2C98F
MPAIENCHKKLSRQYSGFSNQKSTSSFKSATSVIGRGEGRNVEVVVTEGVLVQPGLRPIYCHCKRRFWAIGKALLSGRGLVSCLAWPPHTIKRLPFLLHRAASHPVPRPPHQVIVTVAHFLGNLLGCKWK